MNNNTIEVPIPTSKKRLKTQGSNTYVYHVISRKNNKDSNSKDVVKLIGKVSKEGYMYPNDNYFDIFPDQEITLVPTELSELDSQSKIGGNAAIYKIAEQVGIKQCLDMVFNTDAPLIMSLISYYVLAKDSAAMLYADFMFDHYGKSDNVASEATISRLFNQRISRDKVDTFRTAFLNHCFVEASKNNKKKKRFYVDIDSTNENVSSKGCNMAEYGKTKVDEDLPQINMAYFYDRQTGLPIFYDCFYGSITDMSYCKNGFEQFLINLNQKTSNIQYDFILDRGYFSASNIDYLSNEKLSFAVMGKSNSILSAYI